MIYQQRKRTGIGEDTHQGREALVGVPSQHREATMCAGVGGGERLAEGPDGWPRRRGVGPSLLCCGRFVLLREEAGAK
jgi:hypothetical protein